MIFKATSAAGISNITLNIEEKFLSYFVFFIFCILLANVAFEYHRICH